MVPQRRIDAGLDAFGAALCRHIGRGKALGAQEVADDTAGPQGALNADTIRNYCGGATTPPLDWVLRVALAYGDRFPGMIAEALNGLLAELGYRAVPVDGGGPAFLDANGDGRTDNTDIVLHGNALGTLLLEDAKMILEGTPADSAELHVNRTKQQRHLDALAELARRSTFPRVSRAG